MEPATAPVTAADAGANWSAQQPDEGSHHSAASSQRDSQLIFLPDHAGKTARSLRNDFRVVKDNIAVPVKLPKKSQALKSLRFVIKHDYKQFFHGDSPRSGSGKVAQLCGANRLHSCAGQIAGQTSMLALIHPRGQYFVTRIVWARLAATRLACQLLG